MNFRQLAAVAAAEVERFVASLPPEVRRRAADVALEYADTPPKELVASEGVAPDTLGLFSGPSLLDAPDDDWIGPTVTLYLRNIWDYAEGDPATFREEVRVTYYHELGHFLGLDEDDLEFRGLE